MLILSKFLLLQLLVMRIIMLKVGPKELYEICNTIGHRGSLAALNHSYINKSLYLAQKYVQILNICAYFCGQILSAYIICSKIYEHIFPQNRGYCVYHPSNILQHTFENIYKQLTVCFVGCFLASSVTTVKCSLFFN